MEEVFATQNVSMHHINIITYVIPISFQSPCPSTLGLWSHSLLILFI